MHKPIAVFDAGIGSYAIVAEIQKRLPQQDIVYFADRASFPYGGKFPVQLLDAMKKTVRFLETYDPSVIVIASNAPSIMVLEDLRPFCTKPLYGVFPPLREALGSSKSGYVGIMGVQSLIESPMLASFVGQHTHAPDRVALINASSMVDLVETGQFLFDPSETQAAVSAFTAQIFDSRPLIDVLTLSSTHLPWLKSFFETARPDCRFLDPAQSIVATLGDGTRGTGEILGLVTETEEFDVATFRRMLTQIGVDIPLQVVSV